MASKGNIAEVLHTLIAITDQLCTHVEQEKFDDVLAMLERRERLLERETALVMDKHEAVSQGNANEEQLLELRPRFDMLKQLDEKFVTLFSSKQAEIARRLRQAQNQQLLLAYSQ